MIAHLTYLITVFTFLALVTLGCGEQDPPPEANVIRNKIVPIEAVTKSAQITDLAAEEKSDVETPESTPINVNISDETLAVDLADAYNPEGRIDPFQPLFQKKEQEETVTKAKKKKFVPQTPLQMVDLSQLKVSGIIRGKGGHKALVEEASGKGYIVSEGTYIGNKGGRIITIGIHTIVVEEPHEDNLGNEVLKKRELKINRPAGEE